MKYHISIFLFSFTSAQAQWVDKSIGLTGVPVQHLKFNNGFLFAGTKDGIFRSGDSGNNWIPTNSGFLGNDYNINAIAATTSDVFVSAGGNLYRSNDNGDNWMPSNNGLPQDSITAFVISGDAYYAGILGGDIFRSSDDGSSWELVYDCQCLGLTVISFAQNGNNPLAVISDNSVANVLRSINGIQWFRSTSGLAINESSVEITSFLGLDSDGKILTGTYGGVYRSFNSGYGWEPATNGLPVSQPHYDYTTHKYDYWLYHPVKSFATNAQFIFAAPEKHGVFLSADFGDNWFKASDGLENLDVLSLVSDGDRLFAGTSTGVWSRASDEFHFPQDSLSLVALYTSTNGSNWNDKTNWLTGPMRTWHGVTVLGGRVTEIRLNNNNMTGKVPKQMELFGGLQYLDLGNNQLTGLPDLSKLASTLTYFDVSNNRLTFADLEPNATINGLVYSPQDSVGAKSTVWIPLGEPNSFDAKISGAANLYRWKKNNIAISDFSSNSILIIDRSSKQNEGTYTTDIINSQLPALTLHTREMKLEVLSLIEDSLALVALYNSTDGSHWKDNTNWLTGPIRTWHGITVEIAGVREIRLNNNNLSGSIPNEIAAIGLRYLDLGNNQLEGLPDFSNLFYTLTYIDVSNNKLSFEDLEPNAALRGLIYSPQDSIGTESTQSVPLGELAYFNAKVGGSNLYRWRKNDNAISGYSDNPILIIDHVTIENEGLYRADIINNKLPTLTLYTRGTRLRIPGITAVVTNRDDELATVSPVPAKDLLHLSLSKSEHGRTVKIVDFAGQVLRTTAAEQEEVSINVSDLSRGLYILIILGSDFECTLKIIIN